MSDITSNPSLSASSAARRVIASAAVLMIALVWSYWSTIGGLVRDWQTDDNYSVGQLVPFAAVYLAWHQRRSLLRLMPATCWWGAGLILLAQAARAYGLFFVYESAERYSLVLTVAGVVLLVAGWSVFRQVSAILLFLFLMVPLPGRIHNAISGPLQSQASSGAVFFLELIGVSVSREGNVLLLNDEIPIAVAEACSGLRMLTAFVVVGSVLAFVIERPRWQRLILVASTIPVAIGCNLVRLVVTAELLLVASNEIAERFFHDFAGWTMMPLAFGCLIAELWVMSRLVISEPRAT